MSTVLKPPDQASFFRELNTFRRQTISIQCPCCDREVIVYWRRLNAGMCRVLLEFARVCHRLGRAPGSWVHIDEVFGKGFQKHRDWPVMRHWGIIQPKDKRTLKENAKGYWRVTDTGYLFIHKQMAMPEHGNIYDNVCRNWDHNQVYIDEALGKRFNYPELMEGLL